ncbi:MAG: GDP-mannose 4,6-dehydratase [Candidatus Heimdallarchaeota archaeon]|nr:GDP-mannose 4,6-dehydratase [Candidatus Heimdallarchaeota archaeon]MCK4954419.1 GDP-mannose 4,6-dehydratase [Candidatus Heimdallarchaeota archaeon]
MSKRILVTGGCGFIGSHLVDSLIKEGHYVEVVDDLSANTSLEYLKQHLDCESARFFKYDIRDIEKLNSLSSDFDLIFHLAAQPDVKVSVSEPRFDFDVNVNGTLNILELMRIKDIPEMIFASSVGTVYGETDVFPTPESHPLNPISNYGAAKAASEMYCYSYASLYNLKIVSLRLGNIFGPRATHGVMFDFFHKLRKDSSKLEILGDGKQTKTYLYIEDTIEVFNHILKKIRAGHTVYNVSSYETISVTEIADELVTALGYDDVRYSFTGGKRGWKGDVVFTSVDISKLLSIGWEPKTTIREGIRIYSEWLNEKYP